MARCGAAFAFELLLASPTEVVWGLFVQVSGTSWCGPVPMTLETIRDLTTW
jgi:hypothetical protein